MGWSIGFDSNWNRDIGYGVPAICDHPDCNEEIDRGVSYVCRCGLYFCGKHLDYKNRCACCSNSRKRKAGKTFTPKPDTAEWINWKLTDESWKTWRDENPDEVEKMRLGVRNDVA